MNWKFKCAAFHVLRFLPRRIYRLAQKHMTGRYLDELTDEFLAAYEVHLEAFRRLPSGAVALEFGSGRNLLTPLLLSAAGAGRVFAYDISRLATLEHVNHVIGQLRRRGIPGGWPEVKNLDSDLREHYRIDYRAPGDARATGLESHSVDFVCSTSTLEHVPQPAIEAILREALRICRPRALISMVIDYHDHYATSDPGISRFNFYKFGSRVWRVYNPPNNYQNRLRHCDYEQLFAGFQILRNDAIVPLGDERDLQSIALSQEFRDYSSRDLLALNGLFLLSLPSGALAAG